MVLFSRSKKQVPKALVGVFEDEEGISLAAVDKSGAQAALQFCDHRYGEEFKSKSSQLLELVESRGFQEADFCLALQPKEYQLHVIEAPQVAEEEMAQAAKWKVKDLISYPIEEAAVDVFKVYDGPPPQGKSDLIYVVTCQKSVIQPWLEFFDMHGMKISAIDIYELTLVNLLHMLGENKGTMALVHLRTNSGVVLVCKEGRLYIARHIDKGFEAMSMGEHFFDQILLEVQRTLDYYETRFRDHPAEKVVLLPCMRPLDNLKTHLAAQLGIPVEEVDVLGAMQGSREVQDILKPRVLNAIGAAMREPA